MPKKLFYALLFYPLGYSVVYLNMFVYLFLRLFISADRLNPWERLASRLVLLSFGQILEVKGERPLPNQGNLYVCNHESGLDMFLVVAAIGEHFNAPVAAYHFWIPVWCWVVRAFGGVPALKNSLNNIVSTAELRIKSGGAMFFFAEGTRTPNGIMLLFKRGAFVLAKKSGANVIPMRIDGAYEHQNKRSWWITPGKITVTFGSVCSKSRYESLSEEELRDYIRDQIVALEVKGEDHST